METRTAAAKAAKRANMTLGAWISYTVRHAATEALQAPPLPAPTVTDELAVLMAAMRRLEAARDADRAALDFRLAQLERERWWRRWLRLT